MAHAAQNVLIEYIKENQDKLYRIAYTYTKNQEAALDVVQEAITKSLENIGRLRNEEYVKTWFYRILINEAIKASKSIKYFVDYDTVQSFAPVVMKNNLWKILICIQLYKSLIRN